MSRPRFKVHLRSPKLSPGKGRDLPICTFTIRDLVLTDDPKLVTCLHCKKAIRETAA